MALTYDAPDSADTGGAFLRTAGTFHFICSEVEERAQSKDGKPLDAIRVHAIVLDGTVRNGGVCSEINKQVELMFFDPKPTDKNEGAFARKKQFRMFVALGLLKPDDLGKRGISIDVNSGKGRQFKATVEMRKAENSEKQFCDLSFADIWHVDDPDAAAFPADQKALSMIPASLRLKAEDFAAMKATPNASGSPSSNANGNGHATTAANTAAEVSSAVADLI